MIAFLVISLAVTTIGGLLIDEFGRAAGRLDHGRTGELRRRHAGHPVGQLVGLVDHHRVVFGQHGDIGHGVDREQRVVGHHHVGAAGLLACQFGEALGELGADLPQTLATGHRHLPPRRVGDTAGQVVDHDDLAVVPPCRLGVVPGRHRR